ncbi:MAG: hypothetical protein ACRCSG_04295 [Cellulosilyticaceae bacterium]
MEIERSTNKINVRKDRLNIGTVIGALLVLIISVVVVAMICIPSFMQTIMSVKGELLKGMAIGICALPLFVFVTTKGGADWYKKRWSWICILFMVVVIISIAFKTGGTIGSNMNNNMYNMGNGKDEMNNMSGNMNFNMNSGY